MGLFKELRRRKVTRVAVVYVVTSWLLLQVVDVVAEPLHLPEWFATVVVVLMVVGFPLAIVLAWAFELTPDGMQRTSSTAEAAIVPPGQSRIDYVIIGLLAIAIGVMVYTSQRNELTPVSEPEQVTASAVDASPAPGVLRNSVAVLPFDNLSPDPDNAYFAAGMHEEVLNQLAKIKDMAVIARTSVLPYASTEKPIPVIASELNVGSVMEGSVRYAGDRVRITAQLIDGTTGAHLWSEAFEDNLEDVFGLQLDIATKIASALKVEFSIAEQEQIASKVTDHPEAYARYLRALSKFRDLAPTRAVHEDLDAALLIDPNFATALALKAWLYGFESIILFQGTQFSPETQKRNMEQAERLANKALEIDPNQAGAYAALALVDEQYRRYESSHENLLHAYDLNPNNYILLAQLGTQLFERGRIAEGMNHWERSTSLNPFDTGQLFFFGAQLVNIESWDRAEEQFERLVAVAPDLYLGHIGMAFAACLKSDLAKFQSNAEKALQLNPDPYRAMQVAFCYDRLGQPGEAKTLVAKLLESPAAPDDPSWLFWASVVKSDLATAFDYLDKSVDTNFPPFTARNLAFYSAHPIYDKVRDHPRFQAAVARAKLPWREPS